MEDVCLEEPSFQGCVGEVDLDCDEGRKFVRVKLVARAKVVSLRWRNKFLLFMNFLERGKF